MFGWFQTKHATKMRRRGDFQRLLAEISLARIGLVLSFDASRLARNKRDWYQLLEVCSISACSSPKANSSTIHDSF